MVTSSHVLQNRTQTKRTAITNVYDVVVVVTASRPPKIYNQRIRTHYIPPSVTECYVCDVYTVCVHGKTFLYKINIFTF